MDDLWEAGKIVVAVIAAAVTAIGVWLAHNYRRQMSLNLAATRLGAYAKLWEITGFAASTRLDAQGKDGQLTLDERETLWLAMTDWYYRDGNGMLLAQASKALYLNTKRNLLCSTGQLEPRELAEYFQEDEYFKEKPELADEIRGVLSIRQISLLRTQLKSDLAIYGQTYSDRLASHEVIFLKGSKVKMRARAWRRVRKGKRMTVSESLTEPKAILKIGDPIPDVARAVTERFRGSGS